MADKLIEVNGAYNKRLRDMGDGTFAEVVAVGGTATTGGLTDTELRAAAVPVSDAVVGTTADAIVAAGAVGSISAKLRRLTQGVEDLKTGLILAAGTALLGKVGIDQTTPGTTNKVVADPATATPTLYNVTMTLADTEYSQALPANCRRFEIQCRGAFAVRFAFVTGKVATSVEPYVTLKAGRWYDSGPINQGASPSTVYFACGTAAQAFCILAWV